VEGPDELELLPECLRTGFLLLERRLLSSLQALEVVHESIARAGAGAGVRIL